MPELPDLEVYKENLKPKIINKKITGVSVVKPRVLKAVSTDSFKKKTISKKIVEIKRRGKLLVFELSSQEKLIVHLMLYGQLQWTDAYDKVLTDTCIMFTFGKKSLRFVDGTGWMKVTFDEKELLKLGIEPLSSAFSIKVLQEILKKKQLGDVKSRLVDQKYIVGIGNAYVDEILWEAKILPKRAASLLKEQEVINLHKAVQNVLKNSIKEVRKELKGSLTGEPRDFLAVHRKRTCPRCGTKVKRIELNKKGTYYCPHCQK